jgi:hypothetical protein
LQEPQLHDDEKQEEALRAFGDEKVLQLVPEAHWAQGSEIVFSGDRVYPSAEKGAASG